MSFVLGVLPLLAACSQTLHNENGVLDMGVLTAHREYTQWFGTSAMQERPLALIDPAVLGRSSVDSQQLREMASVTSSNNTHERNFLQWIPRPLPWPVVMYHSLITTVGSMGKSQLATLSKTSLVNFMHFIMISRWTDAASLQSTSTPGVLTYSCQGRSAA